MHTNVLLRPAVMMTVALTAVAALAGQSDDLWKPVELADPAPTVLNPVLHWVEDRQRFQFDPDDLRAILAMAPTERSWLVASTFPGQIRLPMPDGTAQRFTLVESALAGPAAMAKVPGMRFFKGQGIDDPTATMVFDYGQRGFFGMVLSERGTVMIEPMWWGNVREVASYFKHDSFRPREGWRCLAHDRLRAPEPFGRTPGGPIPTRSGTQLVTFRTAVNGTGEYTAVFGSVANGNAAILTSMNRVDGIYERELAISLNVVWTEAFGNAATDPYNNADVFAMLGQNQTRMDGAGTPGAANYDVGHVFGTSGGGVAVLNSVGIAGQKAQGVSSLPSPFGDAFDVDYVAHELGHQFGGAHSFNGTTAACAGNRTATSAYEPGSGTTIMAYAGICGAENVQSNSDPYFHARSFDQMLVIRDRVASNGVRTNTGNAAPTVNAGVDVTIPRSTPFRMTGAGSDPNGDPVLFRWEQFNLGTAAPPNTDDGSRPIFRSRVASSSPTRFFPRLTTVLGTTTDPFENLPTTNRTLVFRLTALDNRLGGGGVNTDDVNVSVNAATGPFTVTAPVGGSFSVGTNVFVNWNVAGTAVISPNVRILISTDGGTSYGNGTATVLLATTPNDGNQAVTLPFIVTTTARIFVEGIGSPFYNVTPANFTITRPTISGAVTLGSFPPGPVGRQATIEVRTTGGAVVWTQAVTLGAGGSYSFAANVVPGTYDIFARSPRFLWRARRSVAITATGATGQDFALINGDVNGDNQVTGPDFTALSSAWQSEVGQSNYDTNADLNQDGSVTGPDFSILSASWQMEGDV